VAFPSPRLIGLLLFWHLSENGGFGKVLIPSTNELFFLARKLIISGVPLTGSQVTFTPLPAAPGKVDPQAGFAVIDNTKIVRQFKVPVGAR